ncbi:DnaJ domain-containing protein [Microbacterium sp. cx-55]|uniref:J domain-containing protein n=1 Tax=Microbacterium sp. cx-55 TaxID=2875948 RepID=UPI001CC18095|nr:J domain-containing protein [Microbacterium sp. cx-55]MBZ4488266.1 DnaJ domain-containing protein [Microbacterium sp. cx-55]UGB34927.1 DnaJ domain-containing protein [Microbacterium sp. cx-55]
MFDSPLSASAYEVLGVAADASDDELRKAFRTRLRETHPDTGGDAALFVRVQHAWELVGTATARAAYDRGRGSAAPDPEDGDISAGWSAPRARADTRPRARSAGQPGGWRRERYLDLIREWVGRGTPIEDPYDAQLVRSAPREIRRLLADALAEEATARTVADLGMGFSVWHDVAAARRGGSPDDKLDHIVLGPSGLYGVLSEDFGGPIGFRRGEIVGPAVPGSPVSDLLGRMRTVARAAGVRFSGAIVVLPDADVVQQITELGSMRGVPVVVAGRSALSTVLRRGVPGARDIGGNEVFDIRTRLDQTVRFV